MEKRKLAPDDSENSKKINHLTPLLIILFVVAFIAAIPLSHNLLAQKSAKVLICHVTTVNEKGRFEGHIIEVSEKSLKAHCAHGDKDDPIIKTKVVGDTCSRGKTAGKCDGQPTVYPPWYKGE